MTKTTYTEMVDSGIEWIGKIPEGWEVIKSKNAFNISKQKAYIENPVVLSLTSKGVKVRDLETNDGQIADSYLEYNKVEKGNLLLNPMDLVTNAFSSVSNFEGVISPAYFNLRPKNFVDSKYGEYYYKLQYWSGAFFAHGKGVSVEHRWTLNKNSFENYRFPLPPLTTQQTIASYLDTKTAEIDQAISLKQQQIKLLQEKHSALINHVVTKGLDPDVELVDSGIERIGKIPKGWEVLPFRRKCQLKQGLQIPQEVRLHEKTDNSLEYITIKSIHNPDNPKEYIENPSNGVVCDINDILFARTGATGETITGVHGVFHNNFFKVSYDKNSIDKSYLVRYLQFEPLKKRLLLLAGTTTIPDLNHGAFLSSPLILPKSKQEQQAIVSYLDTKTAQIDQTIALIQKSIDLLIEYKQSLISHVVTGKVKVG